MAGQFGVVLGLWDADEAPGSLLERVVGEVGLDHVTVAAISGETRRLRAFESTDSAYFYSEGGWHFPPEAKRYAATGLRPHAAKWIGQRDPLRRLADWLSKRGVALGVTIDPLSTPGMASNDGPFRQVNAWGMTDVGSPPCLSHPLVREFVERSIEDVARFAPRAIRTPFLGLDQGTSALPSIPAWWILFDLMRICCCSSCRRAAQAAGVDAEAAQRGILRLADEAQREARRDRDWPVVERMDADPALSAYREARWRSLRAWLSSVASSHAPIELWHELSLDGVENSPLEGTSAAGWRRVAAPSWAGWREEDVSARLREFAKLEVRALEVALSPALRAGVDRLVWLTSELVRGGVERIDFYELTEMPDDAVQWLKQAVRFARRE